MESLGGAGDVGWLGAARVGALLEGFGPGFESVKAGEGHGRVGSATASGRLFV